MTIAPEAPTTPLTHSGQANPGQVEENLTQLEFMAINSELNLADGHARQGLTAGQQKIIDSLPEIFAESAERRVEDLENEAHEAFFHMLGQHSYLTAGSGRVLSCYASSVAMEILARTLATSIDNVALVHPTFDNIPDILRGCGLGLVRLDEEVLHGGDLSAEFLDSVGAIFVTTPNNPTGVVTSEARLTRLAQQCAEHDVILCLDTSFRGFDIRAQYDHYAVLGASGCRWVVIEDTGKLWPTLDLKAGLLVYSDNLDLPIDLIYSDILLGISPMILTLIREFAKDAANGGLEDLHAFIEHNRQIVRSALADIPNVTVLGEGLRVSVERVRVDDGSASKVWAALRDENVYVLPCRKFHWANPAEGDDSFRIALARPVEPLQRSIDKLKAVLESER
ncbi:enduracididine biosynthesis enzyme MppP [Streptomyces sp. NBC_00237]|uniref:enduracididine biosynthesis enzyme MppP n=1 Tax=Streptomyces sp. NBC_00237 TaxID=2975687 RepID=UPI002250A0D8|nr:enduracididine biosynthesis enzyme MppP [Streptomyces sp. NBC_00237]MCX5206939.1 enduracididine biosynthesis enzyme MppP [Streptomyces sp. NBC_00237]